MKKSKTLVTAVLIITFLAAGIYIYSKFASRSTGIIRLNVGDEFIIMLPSNRTTGYEWQIDRPLDGNKIIQAGLVYVPKETDLVGSGGKEEWKFKARGTGRSKIYFKYAKPWEKNVPPADKKVFNVEIL